MVVEALRIGMLGNQSCARSLECGIEDRKCGELWVETEILVAARHDVIHYDTSESAAWT